MDNIIKKLDEVESEASSILDSASAKKKVMVQEQNRRFKEFELQMHTQTQEKIAQKRQEINTSIDEELKKQKADLERKIVDMDDIFNKRHVEIAQQLLKQIIKED